MRLLRHLALFALMPLACFAQVPSFPTPAAADAPQAATAPGTTISSDGNSRSRPAWYQNCRDRVAAAKGHPVDILFVGDSITESWTATAWGGVNRGAAIWDKTYAPRNALNFGVGADRTQDVLWRLDTMDVHDLAPKVTVLLIGTNNTRDTARDIAAGVRAIIAQLQSLYPATRIILVSILPNQRAAALMTDANAILRTFADDRSVFYLDLASKMPPAGDNWLGLGPDKLHPTDAGYQIWADAMEPLLTRLLASSQAAAR